MGGETPVPAGHLTALPPVYVGVPDKSGLLGSGSSRLLNTGLTEAEALAAAEPAPGLYATKAEKRRSDILGVAWILACMTVGVLVKVYGDAANGGYPGDAEWNRQHRKRHNA